MCSVRKRGCIIGTYPCHEHYPVVPAEYASQYTAGVEAHRNERGRQYKRRHRDDDERWDEAVMIVMGGCCIHPDGVAAAL